MERPAGRPCGDAHLCGNTTFIKQTSQDSSVFGVLLNFVNVDEKIIGANANFSYFPAVLMLLLLSSVSYIFIVIIIFKGLFAVVSPSL